MMHSKTSSSIIIIVTALTISNIVKADDCSDLLGMTIENGTVTAASLVEAGKFQPPASPGAPPGVGAGIYTDLPAFCRVQATLTPSDDSDIKVEIWLPAENWNGKYVGIGNGIWAGQLSISQLAAPLSSGFAAATTDTGHTGSGLTAEWAVGHTEKLIDFGYRAVHEMTVTAKQAINEFYASPPSISLWNSCSTGGRQGLMSAYRYPEDYDAISAMAPANPMTDLMTQSMWVNWVNKRTEGAQLDPASLGVVHQAVLNQCDALDGLEDGVVGMPNACPFEPVSLACDANSSEACLTTAQIGAMDSIYEGVSSNGKVLLPGWPRGAEMQLAALVLGPAPFPVATSYFQDLVYADQPNWDWMAMDYAQELMASREYGAEILNVPASGLAPFFARGGKLLLSHGWNDGLIPANNTLQFYDELSDVVSADVARDQLRLFMAPGMEHCAGGEGPNSFDTLSTINQWAITGTAPESILATRTASPRSNAPQLPPMSRPLCPYPQVAQYKGNGDTATAENFSCITP
jgi:feruloyl esterase